MQKRMSAVIVVVAVFGQSAYAAPIQWSSSSGGNDHYYDWVAGYVTRAQASAAATASTFGGVHGYLATIATASENDFFESHFSQDASGQTFIGWLGGFQDISAPDFVEPAGGWRWVTGEPWTFTSWWTAQGFPDDFLNGPQDFVRTQPVGPDIFWDDIEDDPGGNNISGYFIEFPVPEPPMICSLAFGFLPLLTRRTRSSLA